MLNINKLTLIYISRESAFLVNGNFKLKQREVEVDEELAGVCSN